MLQSQLGGSDLSLGGPARAVIDLRRDILLSPACHLEHGAWVVTDVMVDAVTLRGDLSGNGATKDTVPELMEVGR